MQDENIKKLEAEIQDLISNFSANLEEDDISRRILLNSNIKILIDSYREQIKDIAVVSGVIAPFSLMLLDVDKLNINVVVLLIGFVVLLVNIVLSYVFLNYHLESENKKISSAEISWIISNGAKSIILDKNKPSNDRVTSMSEYVQETFKMDNTLGTNHLDINIIKNRASFIKYHKWIISLFTLGTLYIIFSTFINYIIC
ncbi:MAG TPA: hypothetical protein PLZ99_00465 [Parcubacteria group bacterium]|jgi:hypothetical protein|nr:hypothetical protein [Parcubacteria group bacterium]